MYQVPCKACGTYKVARTVISTKKLFTTYPDQRYVLSFLTRRAWELGSILEIDSSNISTLIDSVSPPSTPLEKLDLLLKLLHSHSQEYGSEVTIAYDTDFPLIFARSPNECRKVTFIGVDIGLIDGLNLSISYQAVLTADGWSRVDELRRTEPATEQAFVAMWFDPQMDDAWSEGIAPALRDAKWKPKRADSIEHNDKIDDRIIADIQRSSLVVADLTGHRGGVYYEAGYAMGLGIPVIWTCRESIDDDDPTGFKKVHFDNRQYNFIIWSTPEELKERTYQRVRATVGAPEKLRS